MVAFAARAADSAFEAATANACNAMHSFIGATQLRVASGASTTMCSRAQLKIDSNRVFGCELYVVHLQRNECRDKRVCCRLLVTGCNSLPQDAAAAPQRPQEFKLQMENRCDLKTSMAMLEAEENTCLPSSTNCSIDMAKKNERQLSEASNYNLKCAPCRLERRRLAPTSTIRTPST